METETGPMPELNADERCVMGEGPLWHAAEGKLSWGDIVGGTLFRYDPGSGTHERIYEGTQVGGFTIQADGALLLFGERGAIRIWREGTLETEIDEIPAEGEGRVFVTTPEGEGYPDGMAVDAEGSVWPARLGVRGRAPFVSRVGSERGISGGPCRP